MNQDQSQQRMEIQIEEFYQIIGEIETVRRKQAFEIQKLYNQINEMAAEITRLTNGGLVKADDNK